LVVATLTGVPLLLGAVLGVIVAAVAIALAGRAPGIGSDTTVSVVIGTLFGTGVVLAFSPDSPPGLQHILFGDVLGVSNLDLALAAGLAAAVMVSLCVFHRPFLVVGFDRTTARSIGVNPALADVALLVLIALATVVAVQGLGNLLVVAVLIGPAATARLLCKRVVPMMALAALLAILGGAGGLYLSYYAGTAGGASVAGAMVVLYLLSFAAGEVRGRLGRRASPAPGDERPAAAGGTTGGDWSA
jgi:ABC-type Mn2+/Zn2+ transport system permease subunit